MKKKSIPYFTKDTEAAIVEYNGSTDFEHLDSRQKAYFTGFSRIQLH